MSEDECHRLVGLKRYGQMLENRDYRAAINLVAKGLAADATPTAAHMLLALTETGEREAERST